MKNMESAQETPTLNSRGEDNVGNVILRRFRDPRNHNRVMTLAYQVTGNTINYGFAVCKPVKTKTGEAPRSQGDSFVKRDGRQRAYGRLFDHICHKNCLDCANTVEATPGADTQVFTVLADIATRNPKTSASRIAEFVIASPRPNTSPRTAAE